MIADRVASFFDWFEIDLQRRHRLEILAEEAALLSNGMMHLNDYLALAALLERVQPKQIFEIGTYKGITSDFFLQILPDCHVISVAPNNLKREWFKKKFHSTQLSIEEIGSFIPKERKVRFTQILGDLHEIKIEDFISKYGKMDFVFIDGNFLFKNIAQDTHQVFKFMHSNGTISWHEANSNESVHRYLENELEQLILATQDDDVGGLACWSSQIEEKLKVHAHV